MRSDVQAALREVMERADQEAEAGKPPVVVQGDGNTILVASAIVVDNLHLKARDEPPERD